MQLNKITLVAILFFITLFLPSYSFAHKVMIFGWVEGDIVHTISKFSGAKRAQNAPVSVFDTKGVLLLKGKTDTKGEFSFKLPEKTGLKIVLEASMGHKASCLIPLEQEEDVSYDNDEEIKKEETINTDQPFIKKNLENITDQPFIKKNLENITDQTFVEKNLENIIEKALDKKMSLVLRIIAEKEEKQTISEIISGFGYIFGLVGIALWIKKR